MGTRGGVTGERRWRYLRVPPRRTLLREWAERKIGRSARMRAIDAAVARDGFKFVLLLDLETAMPGAASGPWLGYQMRSVLAPVALTSRPWPVRTRLAAAMLLVSLGALTFAMRSRAKTLPAT